MKNLTAYNEANEREIHMMVGKAMCAYANTKSLRANAKQYIEEHGYFAYKLAEQAGMSEYEATIRILDFFVHESVYAIEEYVNTMAFEEFGV